MERRSKSRIDVQLTCCIQAGKAEATPLRALTENVSRTGMLMRWSGSSPLPKVEGKLTLDVLLPENSEFGPRVMRCRTEVVRVSKNPGGEAEVALRVVTMRFMKPGARSQTRKMNADPSSGKPSNSKLFRRAQDLERMPMATERIS
jgi:c-di-GMP-binding flagellar brake protein YcgR